MARNALADEIAAVRAAIKDLGLGEVEPTILKAAHHTTLLLSPLRMVARVQSSERPGEAGPRAIRELAVARHLADRGAPVLAPLATALAGPHVTGPAVVTLWPYVKHGPACDPGDAGRAAETLRAVHHAFQGYDGELPPYTRALDRCWGVLEDGSALPTLPRDDRDLLMALYRRLRQQIEAAAGDPVPPHGDAHLGNLLMSDHGPIWADFEDACLGPPELDIAGPPSAAWAGFTGADQRLIALCADLKSVCVAVWCWADISRSAEIREAAEHHLHRLRQLARLRSAPPSARAFTSRGGAWIQGAGRWPIIFPINALR